MSSGVEWRIASQRCNSAWDRVQRWLLFAWLVATLGFVSTGYAEYDTRAISEHQAETFLSALVGEWQGEAVRTPRGPLPYGMSLERRDDGAVAGQANPGAAIHSWRFFFEGGRLKLRFLTTFQGNTTPLFLTASSRKETAVRFVTSDPDFLQVTVSTMPRKIAIEIYLRKKAHVSIRLERAPPSA